MIDKLEIWIKSNKLTSFSGKNRQFLLSKVFTYLKDNGVKISDIDNELASAIIGWLTNPNLSVAATVQLQTLITMEIYQWRNLILSSESGYDEEVKMAQPQATIAPISTDVIEMDESESITVDESEFKNKEYDMDFLREIGIDVKDLVNE